MKISEIKDIYPVLYEIIQKRTTCKTRPDDILGAFTWDSTPEGHAFWSAINRGRFEDASILTDHKYKSYFKPGVKLIKQRLGTIKL